MTRQNINSKLTVFAFVLLLVLFTSGNVFANVTFFILAADADGEGFNDPTPVAPVGGNPGTTLGQQRLNALQHALDIWGAKLDSGVPIVVVASFDPMPANILGGASPTVAVRDFPGAEFPSTWYAGALGNKRAGFRVAGSFDAVAAFNSDVNFYLGFDNNHGTRSDLVTVLLHELAHTLNFLSAVDPVTGRNLGATDEDPEGGFTDIYSRHLIDNTNGLHWNEMTSAQRAASATRYQQVAWDGSKVTAGVPQVLVLGSPRVRVLAPAGISGFYQFGTAAFGPPLGSPSVTVDVVAAVDAANAAGPSTTDGCTAFTNAAAVAGRIALIERGTCSFALKARNATAAGAAGVIIYNNAANASAGPPGMATDANGPFVTIPTVGLRRADGLAIVAQLGVGVSAALEVDLNVRAGADGSNRALVFSPNPLAGASSISHFDRVAFKNLLMEPAINADLTHQVEAPFDLTLELMRDIGWFPDADLDAVPDDVDCEPHSDMRDTVILGGIDSGAPNYIFPGGCTTTDNILHIAAASKNHGEFVSSVSKYLNELKDRYPIYQTSERGAIESAAARFKLP